MNSVYLDHAAATPMLDVVRDRLMSLPENLGNPSSIHQSGTAARMLIDQSRQAVADFFETNLNSVIFTSGATESLNLAIVGHFLSLDTPHNKVLISPVGHSAVFGAVDFLSSHFGVEVVYLPTNKKGVIDLDKTEKLLNQPFDIVVCEYGNSELGVLQPVAKLGKMLYRMAKEKGISKPAFIVDAAAAIVTEKISLEYQKCEALSVSGEKIGALSGMGLLLKSDSLTLKPLQKGSHEFGLRGGTENWWGITAFVEALSYLSKNQAGNKQKYLDYRQQFEDFIITEIPECIVLNSTSPEALPHVFHFVLPPKCEKASLFVVQADLAGLQISAGSACSSGSVGGSQALNALGLTTEQSERGLRVSFGWNTSESEIKNAFEILKKLF